MVSKKVQRESNLDNRWTKNRSLSLIEDSSTLSETFLSDSEFVLYAIKRTIVGIFKFFILMKMENDIMTNKSKISGRKKK